MIQAIAIAFIVCTSVVLIVSVICYAVLRDSGRVGRKEAPAVQAARDNLEISRLHAQRDLLEFQRDRVIDARASGGELPPGISSEIKPPTASKKVKGDVGNWR